MSSCEFLPVASGGSFVLARLGNKVGNVYRPPGGDLSFSAIGYEPLPGLCAHLIRLLAISVKTRDYFNR
jgi:hypothetical protein